MAPAIGSWWHLLLFHIVSHEFLSCVDSPLESWIMNHKFAVVCIPIRQPYAPPKCLEVSTSDVWGWTARSGGIEAEPPKAYDCLWLPTIILWSNDQMDPNGPKSWKHVKPDSQHSYDWWFLWPAKVFFTPACWLEVLCLRIQSLWQLQSCSVQDGPPLHLFCRHPGGCHAPAQRNWADSKGFGIFTLTERIKRKITKITNKKYYE